MREAVSAIFIHGDKIFSVKRANYLKVFPGYHAFPGGKVDETDRSLTDALAREMREELNFCFDKNQHIITDRYEVGVAITPSFNPYRFKTHYYAIVLNEMPAFIVDEGEAASHSWQTPDELLAEYERCEMLAVPPMLMLLKSLAKDLYSKKSIDLSLPFDDGDHVPMIESIYGVKHFLPLSHTFPPANRTNSFLIGDDGQEVLIDPSPKDEAEAQKFFNALSPYQVRKVFITHHHPDHHEHMRLFVEKYNVPVGMSALTFEYLQEEYGESYLQGMSVELYQEGDILTQSLGMNVTVYEVPGHDQGQLALAPEGKQWFLVGDLIQTVGTVLVGGERASMSDYFHSLQKVIDFDPLFCIPSHGIAIGGTHKVEKTLEHRRQRERDIIALKSKGKTIDEIVAVLYAGLDERLMKYALATTKAHLDKIVKDNL